MCNAWWWKGRETVDQSEVGRGRGKIEEDGIEMRRLQRRTTQRQAMAVEEEREVGGGRGQER